MERVPRFVATCELLEGWAQGGHRRTWRIETGSTKKGLLKIAEIKAALSSTRASSGKRESHSFKQADVTGQLDQKIYLGPITMCGFLLLNLLP